MHGLDRHADPAAHEGAPMLPAALRPPANHAWPGAAVAAPALALRQAGAHGRLLTVRMLDGFRVWQGSEPLLPLPNGRVRAMLKLLLLRRHRPTSRQRLAALFWPDAEADCARNNLHVALHRLRRTFGRAGRLHLSDEGYQLLTDGEAWIDTEQFVRHADAGAAAQREGRLADVIAHDEQALALYHRDLLEEGEWECSLAADAQDLRTRLGEVVDRLGAAYEQRGDWHRCLRASLRQLQLDDCNEVAHRRLMRAHTALGQLQLAERQYLRCVARLREQFGVGPSAETTAAYRSVAMRQSA